MADNTMQWVYLPLAHTRLAERIKQQVDKNQLPVMSLTRTFEGEGLEAGTPRLLVRLGGCLVGCRGCDTPHSWGLKDTRFMRPVDLAREIMDHLCTAPVSAVSITGGEPMHYAAAISQVARWLHLWAPIVPVSLETSGKIVDVNTFATFDMLSLDIKTPSSGRAQHSVDEIEDLFRAIRSHRHWQIKAVVTDESDVNWLVDTVLRRWRPEYPPLVLTPAAGKSSVAEVSARVKMMLNHPALLGKPIRVCPQLHFLLNFD